MKELNEKEWKEFQERVKKKDEEQSNIIGANISAAVVIIKMEEDYLDIVFSD